MAFHAMKKIRASLKGSAAGSAIAALLAGAALPALAQQDSSSHGYVLGDGLELGRTGVRVGGYASAQWQQMDYEKTPASVSHFSLFLWSDIGPRLKFFTEWDNQENHTADHDHEYEREGSRFLSVERLYLDYSFSDNLTLRAGKFLTPIGRWNQVHADPLVWTTARPLLTRDLFPDNVTGVMAMGSAELGGRSVEYMLYHSAGSQLQPDPTQTPFDHAYGGRLVVPVGDTLQLGLSMARFEQNPGRPGPFWKHGEYKRLLALDFMWARHGYEFSGEALRRQSSAGAVHSDHGSFVQAVLPVHGSVSAVARLEHISMPMMKRPLQRKVIGLNYRYSRAVSIKLENIHDSGPEGARSGLLASASVLF
ncbi:hypothetical protein [Duganella fentianensis]|uniref:hypothetical protein n=1 Tax=Duganella fentianensis TaxID=2692177 RepID=UPI0032B10848